MDKPCSGTDDDETAYRERATALLDEFAQQARGVLRDAGIGLDLFFVVPPSGDAILTFATAAELLRRGVGRPSGRRSHRWCGARSASTRHRCRDVVCAMSHAGMNLRLDGKRPRPKASTAVASRG